MNDKSFAETFEDACNRLGGDIARIETERVHQNAARDPQHAFRHVEVKKPEPWKTPVTGPTL